LSPNVDRIGRGDEPGDPGEEGFLVMVSDKDLCWAQIVSGRRRDGLGDPFEEGFLVMKSEPSAGTGTVIFTRRVSL